MLSAVNDSPKATCSNVAAPAGVATGSNVAAPTGVATGSNVAAPPGLLLAAMLLLGQMLLIRF